MNDPSRSETPVRLDPGRWLEEYGDMLFGYALRNVRDRAAAEDLVQETLLAALEARDRYAGHAAERTWLVGILKHKIIDHLRRGLRESSSDEVEALSDLRQQSGVEDYFDKSGHWIVPPRDWADPEKCLDNNRFWEFFAACLQRLSPVLARIFTLRELSGLSTEEICNELQITATNCGVMLYRARMGLRRCLEVTWFTGRSEETR